MLICDNLWTKKSQWKKLSGQHKNISGDKKYQWKELIGNIKKVKTMNILITGCNGQLGNEMQLLEKENPQHKYFNTDVAELDITDQQAIEDYVEKNEIDGIVNCAAYTAVDKAETNKELCTSLNTVAPAYLAAAVEKRGGWMIQISTDEGFLADYYRLVLTQG